MTAGRFGEALELLELEDYLLLAGVLLLPWAFGGVEIWAYRSAALLLAASAAVLAVKRGWTELVPDRPLRWFVPACLLALWAGVQLIPLPPAAIRMLSPEADRIYRETFPPYAGRATGDIVEALEDAAAGRAVEGRPVGGPPEVGKAGFRMELGGRWTGWRGLSLQPSATLERLSWYVALLLGFLVARSRAVDLDRWRVYRTSMFGLFAALGAFALVQAATWNGKVFWVRPAPASTKPFGPYINPTHFGGAMELAVAWLAGYTCAKWLHPERETIWRSIAPVAAGSAVLCLLAGLASASKMAALLLVLATSLMGVLAARGARSRLVVLAGTALVWGLAAVTLFLTRLGERARAFVETQTGLVEVDRLQAWRAALGALEDFWLTGAGFGTFREVFPAYLPPGETSHWLQLHNDYLEVLLDGGLVGGTLVVWLVLGFAIASRGALHPGLGERAFLEAAGLALGLASLAIHATVDFNHQIPANALLFVAASALLLSRGEAGPEQSP
jgi:hypothetical protein